MRAKKKKKKKKAENVKMKTWKVKRSFGSVWIELIVAENLKLKTEN